MSAPVGQGQKPQKYEVVKTPMPSPKNKKVSATDSKTEQVVKDKQLTFTMAQLKAMTDNQIASLDINAANLTDDQIEYWNARLLVYLENNPDAFTAQLELMEQQKQKPKDGTSN